jgi:hypothetical protein
VTDGPRDATALDTASPNAFSAGREGALQELGGLVQKLATSLSKLESAAVALQLPDLAGREWFDLLQRKLLPQLQDGAYLIVAVVGGTNIGKSVVFNHIAGFRASASSPLASGTKHPVCLVPEQFTETHDLQTLFPSFELRPWAGGDEALQSIPENCLFWRSHERVPDNLVILDTPDVDSDAPINWQRADAVRQAADVLVAVLTQQKYNDAAVKQFFRKAATEDKAAIIVFNQVELPDDEEYWPVWLNTFCSETGLKPEYVYLAPNNRKAAEAIALEFEEREWQGTTGPQLTQCGSLSEVLSRLRFAEIKLRTLRGSLQFVLDSHSGAPAYLEQIRSQGQQFRDAAGVFLRRSMVQNADWPTPPNSLIINDMWAWWRNHREAWTAGIHGFYGRIGGAVRTGWQAVRTRLGHTAVEPISAYRQQEWAAIVRVLQQLYEQLHIITTLNNPLLTARLNHLLSGTSCEALLGRLQQEHDQFDFEGLIHELVSTEMEWLRTERQPLFDLLRKVDGATAVFRPVFTVGFALSGGVGAEHFLVDAATHTLTHMAVDASAVAATTVAGEAAVDAATGMLGQAKASLLRLQGKFTQRREVWLLDQLKQLLLGGLLSELEAGATVADSPSFHEVAGLLQDLTRRMGEIES